MKRGAVLLIFLAAVCFGQTQFTKMAGGESRDEANSMTLTADGGFALTGRTYSFGAGYRDIIVAKFTSEGVVDWAKVYGGEYNEVGYSIIQTSDGGLLIAGNSENFGMSYNGMFLMKLSSTGVIEWAKGVSASYYEYGYSALETGDGSHMIAGNTGTHGPGGDNFYLASFTSAGVLNWLKAIGASGDDDLSKAIPTSDGGIAIVGYTDSYGAGGWDMIIVKLNSSFNVAWAKTIGGSGEDFGANIVQTSDGGFGITGYTDSYGAGVNDVVIAKLSSTGDLEWAASLGGTLEDYGHDITQAGDGGLLVTGSTESYGVGDDDVILAKFTSAGAFSWANTVGNYNEDCGQSIKTTSDGGCAVAGYSNFYASSFDLSLIKYDATGENCMSSAISPTIVDLTDSLTVASAAFTEEAVSRPILDVGDSVEVVTATLADTMLCDNIGIFEDNRLPNDMIITAHPNPFNSAVTITAPEGAEIEILDVSGRHISVISSEGFMPDEKSPADRGKISPFGRNDSQNKFIWQPNENLGSGVYLIRIEQDGRTYTKPVVYVK